MRALRVAASSALSGWVSVTPSLAWWSVGSLPGKLQWPGDHAIRKDFDIESTAVGWQTDQLSKGCWRPKPAICRWWLLKRKIVIGFLLWGQPSLHGTCYCGCPRKHATHGRNHHDWGPLTLHRQFLLIFQLSHRWICGSPLGDGDKRQVFLLGWWHFLVNRCNDYWDGGRRDLWWNGNLLTGEGGQG